MTDLELSFQECERISRSSGSNFYRSFQFLRHDRRRAMHALYAFARMADDATDPPSAQSQSQADRQSIRDDLPTTDRSNGWDLVAWLGWIESLPLPLETSNPIATDSKIRNSLSRIRPALADTVQRFEIPKTLLAEIVRGVDADTRPNEIRTWNALRKYSFQVASAVGLCCAAIWTEPGTLVKNQTLWESAIDCGLAFQLTNILRDLVEDAQRHRVYLPSHELSIFGIDRGRWLSTLAWPGKKDLEALGNWRGLLEVQLERADALYERGWPVIEHLESDGARMFSLMWQTYRTIFEKIRQSPSRVFNERVHLGRVDQWNLASSHFFTPQFHKSINRTNQKFYRNTRRTLGQPSTMPPQISPLSDSADPANQYLKPRVAVVGGGLAGIQASIHLARH
ncbi:MAG: squalene/phytoene synthase family protein, partial [Planctomycetes bacterium]|nr:squalene/phytoene synthase family protein [Planctomycetota bacterium]